MTGIKNLIICNPYEKPLCYWEYNRTTREYEKKSGRRPSGYRESTSRNVFDDPGRFKEIKLVNKIRERVDSWRTRDYPGITGITRELLEYWNDKSVPRDPFFFCQLEAIETLIWLNEAPDNEKTGIDIPSDGGDFQRICSKMATGTGKTVVMAMLIAWQVINKITYLKDTRFSKAILIMTPGLTVKSRLQVLHPTAINNYYDQFKIVPDSMYDKLCMGKFTIHNWHQLQPEEDKKHSVMQLGPESDNVFAQRITKHDYKNIIVINDEAHHAYRSETGNDTIWIAGLDKIHNARNITRCYDFSATPFIPSGKTMSENTLFDWIVSDFSLNDAIESGLTKTPTVSIKDDSGKYDENDMSRLNHIYKVEEVEADLAKYTKPEMPLPELLINAYYLLGNHWNETKKKWSKNTNIPPVMITVCNDTHIAGRVAYAFENNKLGLPELSKPEYLLHIDSKALDRAESKNTTGTSEEDILRDKVNTVGKRDKTGEQIRNIVAVNMLSEGWDANNVTHIMGLRAFTSQLLCEQVVGRGLRRMSYEIDPKTGLLSPEYVYIIGVPFTFLPHEIVDSMPPSTEPRTLILPDPDKKEYEISWPNVDRINVTYSTKLAVDWNKVKDLPLTSKGTIVEVKLAGIIDGKPHLDELAEIKLQEIESKLRMQSLIFDAAKIVFDSVKYGWSGNDIFLFVQLVKLVEEFIDLDKIVITDTSGNKLKEKMTIWFNMNKIVSHICDSIDSHNTETEHIVLNQEKPIKSTGDKRPWYAKGKAFPTKKTHANMSVYDSGWERTTGDELDRNDKVVSWMKNYTDGFIIYYQYKGVTQRYIPDFIIVLNNGIKLVLEIKGRDDEQNKAKREGLNRWVKCVNNNGKYGIWGWEVAFDTSQVPGIIEKYSSVKRGVIPKIKKRDNSTLNEKIGTGLR